ncbi:MAG: sensor histidine kinase, partial [Anaerolineae bacterium]|nr:sensor histidine kinase [Anaerolineae bacterium]
SVQSHGQGMTTEQIRALSNHLPFEQTIFEQDGHNLGLRIAQRIAQIHSGKLTIDSTPGVGTTARIELPLYVHPQQQPAAEDCPAEMARETADNVTAKQPLPKD